MPPGAKKRRAARRKQQQQQQHASDSQDSQPSSPHPQGNGGAPHDLNGSTDASDDDRDSPVNGDEVGGGDPPEAVSEVRVSEPEEVRVSEPAAEEVRVLELAEEVRVSEPAAEEVRVSELAEEARVLEPAAEEVRVSEPAEEARVSGVSEVRVSEPEGVRVSGPEIPATAAAAVSVEPAVVNEEVVQAVEDKAVLSENVVDALVVSAVEKPRDVDVVGGELPRVEEGREAAITEEASPAPAPAPLIRRRAAWWDCCGLFDVARGSEA